LIAPVVLLTVPVMLTGADEPPSPKVWLPTLIVLPSRIVAVNAVLAPELPTLRASAAAGSSRAPHSRAAAIAARPGRSRLMSARAIT
jgi:hypothetical protein